MAINKQDSADNEQDLAHAAKKPASSTSSGRKRPAKNHLPRRKSAKSATIEELGMAPALATLTEELELSMPERMFVLAYFANGFRVTPAAIEAGYTPSSALVCGQRILGQPHVKLAIAKMQEHRARRLMLTADWAVAEAVDLYNQAKADKAWAPAAKILQMLGNEAGVFQQHQQVEHRHTHSIEHLLATLPDLPADEQITDGDWSLVDPDNPDDSARLS